MNSTEKFDRAMQIVCGTYTGMELHGPFTWKHAVYFMNLHEEVSHVCLGYGMQLEAEDDDDFFEAVVQWLLQKKVAAMIDIQCPDLMDGFDPHLKECVENRTTYNVKFVDGWTVIFQQPEKP
uniref:DUF4262 domain-containing protein n=1 Tax=Panagrellus redivivus TaxID=6233 RepID=A0A7E4VPD5_PANRE